MTQLEPLTQDQFIFVPVTSQKQWDFHRFHHSIQWSGNITRKEYIERDTILARCDISLPGTNGVIHGQHAQDLRGIYAFLLKDTNIISTADEDIDTYNIVSGAELLIRDASVFKDGVVNAAKSGTVASVFTLENHRGKGYAKILLELLNKWTRKNLTGGYTFNILYSEVGEYYSQFGYKSLHVPTIKVPLELKLSSSSELVYLKKGQFGPLIERSWEKMKEELLNLATTSVVVNFNQEIVEWFHTRSQYYNQILNQGKELNYGLKMEKNDLVSYIIWTYTFTSKTVDVLKIDSFGGNTTENYKEVIGAALTYLKQAAPLDLFDSIKIWDTAVPKEIKSYLGAEGSKIDLVNDSISAIWFAQPDKQKQFEHGEITWENNLKYLWF